MAGTEIANIYIPPPRSITTINLRTVPINVNFLGTNWTADAMNAFNFAVSIWGQIFTSDVPITIDANFAPLGAGILGQARANNIHRNFDSSDPLYQDDTWYADALADKLHGADLSDDADIITTFSSTFPFYFGTDGMCPATDFDFATVVLHELCHGLGFFSSANSNTIQGIYGIEENSEIDPTAYDRFIIDGNGVFLTDFAIGVASNDLGDYLQSNDLWWESVSGASGARLFAPAIFQGGSSISHLNDNTYDGTPNALMTHALDFQESIHDPGQIVIDILADIGWEANPIPPPTVEIIREHPTCGNSDNGTASALATGGLPPYTYLWSNSETTQTIENLSPGNYSVTVTDAFGDTAEGSVAIFPEIIVTSDNFFWSDIVDEYNLSPDQLIDRSVYVEDDLLINNNYTFSGVTFNFAEGAKLLTSKNIIINDFEGKKSILKTCDGEEWEGILVYYWGKLDMDYTEIYNARIGIEAQYEATLELGGFWGGGPVLIKGNSGDIGVYLNRNVSCTTFGLEIENYETGVKSENNTKMPRFSFTTINNSNIGFDFYSSPAIVGFSTTDSRETSFKLDNCPGSILGLNIFRSGDYGIVAHNSPSLSIMNPACDVFLKTAINLNECPYSSVTDIIGTTEGFNLKATEYGIKATSSPYLTVSDNEIMISSFPYLTVSDNEIMISGIPYLSGGGIQLNECSHSKINNNTIDANQCTFGIETNGGLYNTIKANFIDLFSSISIRTAAIRTLGDLVATVDSNIINGLANVGGILASNSSGNTYSCNELSSTSDGLNVYYNSIFHDIKGNKFLNCSYDLITKSVLGFQYFKGNEFYNGRCLAEGLTPDEIEQSKFLVNEIIPHHIPSNPSPDNWFEHQDEQYYYECEVEPREGKTGFDDENVLSSYFDRLQLTREMSPERYFVNMLHLLEYEFSREDYSLPHYISEHPVWAELSDLTELATAINSLRDVTKLSGQSQLTQNDLDDLRVLQTAYMDAEDELEREQIYAQLNQLMTVLSSSFEQERVMDSITLDQLIVEFGLLAGRSDAMVSRWADVYNMYIDYAQKGEVIAENKTAILNYSMECADKYGDAIHLARSLANTFDATYFDVHDDCPEEVEPRSSKNTLDAVFQPNPTNGELNIHFDDQITGMIELFDMTGKLVYFDKCEKRFEKVLHLNLNEGVFMMRITSDKGESFTEKVVITK